MTPIEEKIEEIFSNIITMDKTSQMNFIIGGVDDCQRLKEKTQKQIKTLIEEVVKEILKEGKDCFCGGKLVKRKAREMGLNLE